MGEKMGDAEWTGKEVLIGRHCSTVAETEGRKGEWVPRRREQGY